METIDRNIIDVAKQLPLPPTMKQTDTQTTIVNEPAISREDVTQLESVITKTIENTNEQEVEQEIKKSINERKAATEKVMSNDPNVATVDDFLPIVEIFSDDDAIEIKPKGSLELPSPENDYVIEDSHSVAVAGSNDGIGDIDAPKEEKILPKTPTAIENEKIEVTTVRRFTEKLSDEIAPNKIDDVTINSKTEKVSQIAGQPIQPPFTAESEFTQKFFHVCHHVRKRETKHEKLFVWSIFDSPIIRSAIRDSQSASLFVCTDFPSRSAYRIQFIHTHCTQTHRIHLLESLIRYFYFALFAGLR